MNAVAVCLLIKEVKHVFDCKGEGGPPTDGTEQCLEQVIHKLLQCPLQSKGKTKEFKLIVSIPLGAKCKVYGFINI